jgi:hypothetical protein
VSLLHDAAHEHAACMSFEEWRSDFERVDARIEHFKVVSPDGDRYVDTSVIPGPLLKSHDALTIIGLQHGWLTDPKENA